MLLTDCVYVNVGNRKGASKSQVDTKCYAKYDCLQSARPRENQMVCLSLSAQESIFCISFVISEVGAR